jgi:hypothetical protein
VIGFLVTAVLLFVFAVVIVHGTMVKNNWGLNFKPVSCPRCRAPLRSLRIPRTLRQMLWGGATCPKCGCEVDKWGRDSAPRSDDT